MNYADTQEETTNVVTLTEAARIIGVAHQTLSQYLKAGKLSAQRAGTVWLVNPNTAKKELENAGFYRRKENRKARWQK